MGMSSQSVKNHYEHLSEIEQETLAALIEAMERKGQFYAMGGDYENNTIRIFSVKRTGEVIDNHSYTVEVRKRDEDAED